MENKPTNDMMNEIKGSSNIDKYIKNNNEFMINDRICDQLNKLICDKNIKKSVLFDKASLSESYGHQIISGIRTPSRDAMLKLLISMELKLDEIQEALKYTGFAQLYPKDKRDSIIIFGIMHEKNVLEIKTMLYDKHEDLL